MKSLITIAFALTLFLAACMPPPKPTVKITQPVDGALVDPTQMVRGTSQALPEGQAIWVVVFVQRVGRYYPQNQAANVQPNGSWASITYIGIPSDVGLKFDLMVVLTDKDGQAAFNKYLVDARNKSDYSGLEQLPSGVTIYDRVSVIRK